MTSRPSLGYTGARKGTGAGGYGGHGDEDYADAFDEDDEDDEDDVAEEEEDEDIRERQKRGKAMLPRANQPPGSHLAGTSGFAPGFAASAGGAFSFGAIPGAAAQGNNPYGDDLWSHQPEQRRHRPEAGPGTGAVSVP